MKLQFVFMAMCTFYGMFFSIGQGLAQEEVDKTRSIERDGILLEFPPESLQCIFDSTKKGEEKECKLLPPGGLFTKRGPIVFTLYSDGRKKTIAFKGEVILDKAVTIRYADPFKHSQAFIEIGANALKGLRLKSPRISAPGPFDSILKRGRVGDIVIKEHGRIYSTQTSSKGFLTFSVQGLRISGVKVALPGTEASQTIDLDGDDRSTMSFDMSAKRAKLLSGVFTSSSPLRFSTPQTLSVYGLQLPISQQATVQSLKVSISKSDITAAIKRLVPDSTTASYKGQVAVTASDLTDIDIGLIESPVTQIQEAIVFSEASTTLRQIRLSGNLKLCPPSGATDFLNGTGTLTLASLMSTGFSGELKLISVSQYPNFGQGLSIKGSELSATFTQSGSDSISVKGSTLLDEVRLGGTILRNINTAMKFFSDGQGRTVVQLEPASAYARVIPVGVSSEKPGKAIIEGDVRIDHFSGYASRLMSNDRRVDIAKNGIQFRFINPSIDTTLLGGALKVDLGESGSLVFRSGDLVANVSDGLHGNLVSSALPMTAPALHSITLPEGVPIRIGNGMLSATQAYFTVDLQDASVAPFGITGSFVVKGLRHQFDTPTAVRMNDIQMVTSIIEVPEITVSVNLVRAKVSIKGFTLAGAEFSWIPKEGKTETPTMTGRLASPMTIAVAETEVPFTSPVEWFNLNVQDARLSLKDVQYVDPGKSTVRVPSATLSVSRLGDEAISAVFQATNGEYDFSPESKEFIGQGSVGIKVVKLDLNGPRIPLKGTLMLDLDSISVKGISMWRPMDGWEGYFLEGKLANPTFTVPLNVSTNIPEMSGTFTFNGNEVDGALVSHGEMVAEAVFLGPPQTANKWDKDWLLTEEVRWRTEYPCGGTWQEPIRRCEAWGILIPRIEAKLRWNYTIAAAILLNGRVTDVHFVPKREERDFTCDADPDICPGGSIKKQVVVGLKACRGTLVRGSTLVPWGKFKIIHSLSPDLINDNGEIAKFWNAAHHVVFGFVADFLGSLVDVVANIFTEKYTLFGKCQ